MILLRNSFIEMLVDEYNFKYLKEDACYNSFGWSSFTKKNNWPGLEDKQINRIREKFKNKQYEN